jgi:flagellar motor switch protein FliG
MRSPSGWAVGKIEEALRSRLSSPASGGNSGRSGGRSRTGGVRGLAKVLSNAEPSLEQSVLEALGRHDPALSEQVRSLMFVFDDLTTLDDRAVQRVLSDVDATSLAVALKGAGEDVSSKVLRNMSQRARDRLEEEIDLLGPLPKKEIEAAREKVSSTVLDLSEAGEIQLRRGGDAELVA